jgi:hypothetical protein
MLFQPGVRNYVGQLKYIGNYYHEIIHIIIFLIYHNLEPRPWKEIFPDSLFPPALNDRLNGIFLFKFIFY